MGTGRNGAIELDSLADVAEGDADTAEGLPLTRLRLATVDDGTYGTLIDDHGSSGWTMVTRGVAYEARIVYNITTQGKTVKDVPVDGVRNRPRGQHGEGGQGSVRPDR